MITKPWRTSLKLHEGDDYTLCHWRMKKGGYSSLHKHMHMINKFVLLSGNVSVIVCPLGHNLSHTIEYKLVSWKPLVINVNVLHRFVAHTDSVLYEIYTSKVRVDDNDIIRLDSNGIK